MKNNNNTSGDSPFRRLYGDIISNMLTDGTPLNNFFNAQMSATLSNAMSNNTNLFGQWTISGLNFLDQYSNLQAENVNLRTENEELKKDNTDLKQKYQNACFSSQNALKQVLSGNNIIQEQKKTIKELEQKLNDQSNELKISAQNKKSNIVFSIDQNNRFSLLGKIESLKGKSHNLEQLGAMRHSHSADSRNQQTK